MEPKAQEEHLKDAAHEPQAGESVMIRHTERTGKMAGMSGTIHSARTDPEGTRRFVVMVPVEVSVGEMVVHRPIDTGEAGQ